MDSGHVDSDLGISENAITVLERRYLKKNAAGEVIEGPAAMFRRVAENIAQADASHGATPDQVAARADEFYRLMTSAEFMPNSPTLMNAGREFQQLAACFVLPIEDSMESIFEAVKQTALIHKSGGGTGFSFSRLRPTNDVVSSTMGVSSGPISFMKVFDAATEAIKQGGVRRGANMAVLRVDHPNIEDFVEAKTDHSILTNFNLSVGMTTEFMDAVYSGDDYPLVSPRTGDVVRRMHAGELFRRMVQLAWEGGDPGIIFLDRLNESNPTPQVGEIESTNPCGEQPLLPYESCNLGSINLAKFVDTSSGAPEIDWDHLGAVVDLSVRFLDNVIDMNEFPLPQIAEMTRANRKIGLGVMGFSDLLITLGVPYNSERAVELAEETMQFVRDRGREMSARLADERGAFPNWEGSALQAEGLPPQRNATVTTIAPTGTISMIAGCSSGIEPLFSVVFTRHVLDDDQLLEIHPIFERMAHERGFHSPELMKEIAAHGTLRGVAGIPDDIVTIFPTAHDVTPEWHLRIQAAFQKFTDNAVSKTVNFPNEATVEDVERVYRLAWELGCKGVTIYRDGSRDEQVLTTGRTEKAKLGDDVEITPRPRPDVVTGVTRAMTTGCGKLYVTINEDERGPFELFAAIGKVGGCASAQSEAIARLVSLAFRCGISASQVVRQLKGISCHMPAWEPGGGRILSCADSVAKAIERHINPEGEQLAIDFNGTSFGHTGACPECGGTLVHDSGCNVCRDCGYSQCE